MKYKCLVLDHDDTVVASTAQIHYPSFVDYLYETGRNEIADGYSLEKYLIRNFHPGIISILRDECGMDDSEVKREEEYWANYVERTVPTAYPGMADIIARFRAAGGKIVVDSHSLTRYIERDYMKNSLPMPDVIYGWDIPKEHRKPSPYTVLEVIKKYGLEPSEVLVVDDLKPGYDMARGAGADFAAAGWAYRVPEIEEFMRKNCDFYLESVADLSALLFG